MLAGEQQCAAVLVGLLCLGIAIWSVVIVAVFRFIFILFGGPNA